MASATANTKYLAITIAGAVSLGSYEAGATYEILDAIRQHNEHPETRRIGDFIRIDVLTGASAGGMTAAIVAQKLLYAKDLFVDTNGSSSPYDNPLYNTWVKGIDIGPLLDTADKPIDEGGDPATLSLLSSSLIATIAKNTIALQDADGNIAAKGGAHNAVDPERGIRLGLALTNINGINYGYTMFGGDKFQYTDFSDQMLRHFTAEDPSFPPWQEVSQAAIACGAFPFAFRTKQLLRVRADYLPPVPPGLTAEPPEPPHSHSLAKPDDSPTLEPWPNNAQSQPFTYTDGGVLQNQPLGMAKNLVDMNDNHLGNDHRFYLFVSPSPMEGKQDLQLTEENTTLAHIGGRLIDIYRGQAVFRDWIEVQDLNDKIELLNQRAGGLADALKSGALNAASLSAVSQQILDLFYPAGCTGETQAEAEARLEQQYSGPSYLGGLAPAQTGAFLKAVLTLEKAANLGDHDEMQVYGIVTQGSKLAGAGISAFVGFLDQEFRDHDYDWGRTVAQNLLANPKFQEAHQLGPIRYTPAAIRPIDTQLDGLHLKDIPKADVKSLRAALTRRVGQMVHDAFPNPVAGWVAKVGVDQAVGLILEWEFSRDHQ
jgi:hypothetical protein